MLEQNLTYLSGNEQQFLAVNERDATILGSNTLQPVLQAVSPVCDLSTLVDVCNIQSGNELKTGSKPDNFPFRNTSFPGDPNNDVLLYPAPGARSGKQLKKDKQYFFLITSKEAIEFKKKQKQEKAAKEKDVKAYLLFIQPVLHSEFSL